MDYFDKELLENKDELKRQNYTTLETGIYAGNKLITFSQIELPEFNIYLSLPDEFIVMPEAVKNIKYPSKESPTLIFTSLDSTVNIGFNLIPVVLQEGETKNMISQFQNALKNINPSIIIKNPEYIETGESIELSWFEYKGYQLDGQSYNRVYIVKLRKTVLYCMFNCFYSDKDNWEDIVNKIFLSIKEKL